MSACGSALLERLQLVSLLRARENRLKALAQFGDAESFRSREMSEKVKNQRSSRPH